jgi:phospholipid/cholesterol/gamma-HCH transport system substrate-binding protein
LIDNKSAKVGLITLIMLFCVSALIIWKSDVRFRSSGYKIEGVFQDIGGLMKGSDIRYRGYRVGKVDKIMPNPKDIRVTFWINKEIDIPQGSRAKILFDGLVGENYIGIVPNEKEAEFLVHGDLIYGKSGSDLANFIDLGSQNMVHAEAILDSLRSVFTSKQMTNSIVNIVGDVETISHQLSIILSSVNNNSDGSDLKSLLSDVAEIADRLNKSTRSMEEDGNFTSQFISIVNGLAETSKNLNETLDDESVKKLQNIIDNIDKFSEMLGAFTYHNDRKESVRRSGNMIQTLSKLRLETEASLQYATADDQAFYLADVNFDVGKHFIRAGIGDRLGTNEFLNFQHGYHVGPKASTRMGLFYQKPGVGFDYLVSKKTSLSLEVYDPNNVAVDLLTKYRMMQEWNMLMRVRNNTLNHNWDNLDLGLSYQF